MIYLFEFINDLIEPSEEITNVKQRQQARLVIGIFLFILFSSIVYVLIPYSKEESRGPVALNIIFATIGVYFGKGKWSQYAGYTIPMLQIFPVSYMLYLGLDPGQTLKWYSTSFLFSAIFLPNLGMVVLFLAEFFLSAYLVVNYGSITFARLMENLVFLTVIFAIFFIAKQLYLKMDRERYLAEDKLRDSKNYIENITRSISDGLVVISTDQQIQATNPTACQLLGYTEQQLLGKNVNSVFSQEVPQENFGTIPDYLLLCQDRSRLPVRVSRSPLENINNAKLGEVWVVHDLSIQIEKEKSEREQAEKIAYQAGMVEMNASIFHNIGNTISHLKHLSTELQKNQNIMGDLSQIFQEEICELKKLSDGKERNQFTDVLRRIQNSIEEINDAYIKTNDHNLTHITKTQKGVDHIIEIIKIQQQMSHGVKSSGYNHKPFNLVEMIHDVIEMESDLLKKNQITLNTSLDENLPPVEISRNALMQLLINILQNSQDSIKERASLPAEDREINLKLTGINKEQFEIIVDDNGMGMNEEILNKIFQYGFTTKENGNGFGLHFAANFVQQQGGKIDVSSGGVDQGCCIKMTMNYSNQ